MALILGHFGKQIRNISGSFQVLFKLDQKYLENFDM